jgi:phosphatidylglycerophosphate synthase
VTSRAATDELFAGLRAGRWKPSAWARFMASSARRSVQQARRHPRALAQLTVLHAVFGRLAGRRGRRWTAVSWALAVTHLGMLEGRPSLGLPSTVTLLRANLPAIWPGAGRWLPAVALATDLADGRIARRLRAETPFGVQADSLADAASWTWFVLRHEPSRPVQAAALAAWAAPVAVVTVASFRRGRMLEALRPVMLRPAAAMQAVVAVRALLRPRPALSRHAHRRLARPHAERPGQVPDLGPRARHTPAGPGVSAHRPSRQRHGEPIRRAAHGPGRGIAPRRRARIVG